MAAFNPAFNVYPNPLSYQATFSFSLPEAGNVSVDVMDITGRIVQTVCNEIYENGPHEIVWSTAGISPGSYYVRFRTVNDDQTMALTVIK